MSRPLDAFSTDELLAEIVRRRNASERKPITHWCDDCKNFKVWTGDGDPPTDYNACGKGHKMSFRVGDPYSQSDWGHYRRVCEDREPLSLLGDIINGRREPSQTVASALGYDKVAVYVRRK